MKTFDITSSQKVTAEQIDDVLVTAFEGGSNYWCDEVRVRKHFEPKEEYTYMSDVLTRGGVLEIHDGEDGLDDGKWYPLDLKRLIDALGEEKLDFDNYDAGDADRVLQCAIFGEVIYG